MREPLKFGVVDTDEKYKALMKFAASFPDGGLHVHDMELPIVLMFRGDNLFGYYQQIRHPLIVPAFHPDETSPRDFKEAIESIQNFQCMQSVSPQYQHGICYWAISDPPAVHEDIIRKFGVKDTQMKLWAYRP